MTRGTRTRARASHLLFVGSAAIVAIVSLPFFQSLRVPTALSASGDLPWGTDVSVSPGFTDPQTYSMVAGSDQSVFIGYRAAPGVSAFRLHKLRSSDGAQVWGGDGIGLGVTNGQLAALVADQNGGAVISTYEQDTHEGKVEHVLANGTIDWTKVYDPPGGSANDLSQLAMYGTDSVIHVRRDNPNNDFLLSRYQVSSGSRVWSDATSISGCEWSPNALAVDRNDRIIFVCDRFTGNPGGTHQLFAYDGDGNLLTQSTYDFPNQHVIEEILPTADGGFITTGTYSLFGTHRVMTKFNTSLTRQWDSDTTNYSFPSVSPDGARVFAGYAPNVGVAQPSTVVQLDLATGNPIGSTQYSVGTCEAGCSAPRTFTDGTGINAYTQESGGGYDTGRFLKVSYEGYSLIGSPGNPVRTESLNVTDMATTSGATLRGIPDGHSGAIFAYINDSSDGIFASRAEGAPGSGAPGPSSCTTPGVGKTLAIFRGIIPGQTASENLLIGGAWGWTIRDMRAPNTIIKTGSEPTNAVSAKYINSAPPSRVVVGGPDGWKGFSLEQAAMPEVFSSTLPANVVDNEIDGTMFAGGTNGWEIRDSAGTLLTSGAEPVLTGSLVSPGGGVASGAFFGGPWGWKEVDLSGGVVRQGSESTKVAAASDSYSDSDDFYLRGSDDGFVAEFANPGSPFTQTTPTLAGETTIGSPAPTDMWAFVGGSDGMWLIRPALGSATRLTTDRVVAFDAGNFPGVPGPRFGKGNIYAGPDGWGAFDTNGNLTKLSAQPTVSVATMNDPSGGGDWAIAGGAWGWSVTNTGNSPAVSASGTENVVACIDSVAPEEVVGNFTLYDSVLQVTDGTSAPYDTIEFGNNGKDIASTGNIYLLPGGSAVASVPTLFGADATSNTQYLSIGAGTSGLSALTTKAGNNRSALYAEQNGAGDAGSFVGSVRIEGLATVSGLKPATVKTSRGDTKLFMIESPDVRFEDLGRAELHGGRVTIHLDPVFLETIEGDFRVQLTAEGVPTNLRVVRQTSTAFTVEGDRDVTFVYRVSAARRGYADVRFTLPEVSP